MFAFFLYLSILLRLLVGIIQRPLQPMDGGESPEVGPGHLPVETPPQVDLLQPGDGGGEPRVVRVVDVDAAVAAADTVVEGEADEAGPGADVGLLHGALGPGHLGPGEGQGGGGGGQQDQQHTGRLHAGVWGSLGHLQGPDTLTLLYNVQCTYIQEVMESSKSHCLSFVLHLCTSSGLCSSVHHYLNL